MDTPFEYFFNDRTNPRTIAALRDGPLASPLEAYAQRLHEDGYATHSGFVQLRLLGCFNRWLDRKGLTSEDVDPATIEQYLRGRTQSRKLRKGDSAALFRLLTMLRPDRSGVNAPPPTPVDVALGLFQQYLRQERSLSEATVINYTPVARHSCRSVSQGSRTLSTDHRGRHHRVRSTAGHPDLLQTRAAGGDCAAVLSALPVPSRHRSRRLGGVRSHPSPLGRFPKCQDFLPESRSKRSLDSCDRGTAIGRRDYALLLLLARLGLRAGEVVALTLDDLDWETGLVTVRGKGKRVAQMPLLPEVGTAIADYLSTGRPPCSSRRVFIRAKAPLTGFANSVAICSLVDTAMARAGVESEYRGSHVFRHSLATGMINQGASLDEIGDLLRHQRPDTTRIYAKVDLVSLRSIALPWPGGSR
jgi:site-specific recombinase XerD